MNLTKVFATARFPADFMFQLNAAEWLALRSPSSRGHCCPRPSQTRTSVIHACGSSLHSFAHQVVYNGAPLPSVGSASSSVPRRLQYYQSTKTSGAYHGSAYLFADPLQLRLSQFAPTQRRSPRRPGPAYSRGTLGYSEIGRYRISQVPGESIPYLCPALGPRSVRPGLTITASSVLPPQIAT
jgi:hypothetical protein